MSEPRLFYIDDSGAAQTGYMVYAWCELRIQDWGPALEEVLRWRAMLLRKYQVPKNKEIHTTKFANGRGNPSLDPKFNGSKQLRQQAVDDSFAFLAKQDLISVGAVYSKTSKAHHGTEKIRVYEELVKLIDRRLAATGDHGIVVMDGNGTDTSYITAHRQLELKTRFLIEDPAFQHSHRSQWVQLADLVAYAAYQHLIQQTAKQFAWGWYSLLSKQDVLGGPLAI